MNQKGPKQIKRFARAIAKGSSLQRAMLDAGYAPSTARRGRAALSHPMWEALARESNKLELLGRKISPERQANLVRGRLVQNVILGTDKGTLSARVLGSDRRISLWQSDSQVGMVILQAPPVPKIDHEVPLFPVEHEEAVADPRASEEKSVMSPVIAKKSHDEESEQPETAETPAKPEEE